MKVEDRPVRHIAWMRWVAAAAVLIIALVYLWSPPVAGPPVLAQEIAPGSSKATLTLADGSVIALDSAGNRLIQPGIHQAGGRLKYDASASVSYNTLKTPRGGRFRITLPDGTEVWLNAASSLKYPTAFKGKERRVEVSGEAFFEVAQDAARPFVVSIHGKENVTVLGTAFNVNAYAEEPSVNTTLLSGSIRIREKVLQPGEQASLKGTVLEVHPVRDLAQVTAWKEGLFDFHHADLKTVMRQLARWYDVEVVYAGEVPDRRFQGSFQMELNLSEVLNELAQMQVKFKLEGRTLTVMP